jgi:hypothetical protein
MLSEFHIVANGRAAEQPMSEETLLQRVKIPLGLNVSSIDSVITDTKEYLERRKCGSVESPGGQTFGTTQSRRASPHTSMHCFERKPIAFSLRTDDDNSPHPKTWVSLRLDKIRNHPLQRRWSQGATPYEQSQTPHWHKRSTTERYLRWIHQRSVIMAL